MKMKAECWDMADFFQTEKYPTYAAFCHKQVNSGSHHGEDGPENESDTIKEIYNGDKTHTDITKWISKIYKKCRNG